jgi:addiction module RelE/StbE family toxin
MIEIGLSKSFERAFKKRIKGQLYEDAFYEKLDLFSEDPFHPQLKTHKLSGKLKMLWSFSIGYDLRVVFEFVTNNKVILEDIGTHNEVY